MFKHFPTLATLCATLLTPMLLQAPMAQGATAVAAAETVGRVIVKYRSEAPIVRRQSLSATATAAERADQADTLGRRVGLTLRPGHSLSERSHVVFAQGLTSAQLAQRLAADPDVEYAVPDERRHGHVAPNDLYYPADATGPGQWYLRPPTATTKAGIDAEGAWALTTGSPSVVVAVLDSGVRFDHPDLAANLLPGYDMIGDDPDGRGLYLTANDGNGRDSNASDPGDWITQAEAGRTPFEPCTQATDSGWHGTATASLIAAQTNNSEGMASVGRTVKVLPVRVLGKCGGYDSDIIAGMRWAVGLSTGDPSVLPNPLANRAKVLNVSLGGVGACSAAYRNAINDIALANAVVVASAGNDTGRAVNSPANCPGVVAVSGLRHSGTKVDFSDIGPEATIAAPAGYCTNTDCQFPIVTATNPGLRGPTTYVLSDPFNYNPAAEGTSFSAPLVAGTVALMMSVDPTLTPLEVKLILQGSARAFPAAPGRPVCTAPQYDNAGNPIDQQECQCSTGTCGAGMLDARQAVQLVVNRQIGNGIQARIDVDSRNARVGQALTLSGANSIVIASAAIVSYRWAITSTGSGAAPAFSNGQTTATGQEVQLTPQGTGTFAVRLTVTDNQGFSQSSDLAIVARPQAESSGGGGALGVGWLALLGLAVVALRRSAARA